MRCRRILYTILALLPCVAAPAQDYAVELLPDKKVIYVDKLGLPGNTSLMEVLRMLPELVVREGNDFLIGYDVFLDSKSLAHNKNGMLATMKLFEVEKIEISTSAVAAQQRNGMAGAITIVSREMPRGLSGSVTTNLNTLWEAYPNANINYSSDKLEVRANLGLEYYNGGSENYFEKEQGLRRDVGNDTISERTFQETARVYLKYKFTDKDQLKLWVLESYGLDNRDTYISSTNTHRLPDVGEDICRVMHLRDTDYVRMSKMNLGAFTEYEHTFREDMKLSLSADYIQDSNREGQHSLDGVVPDVPKTLRAESRMTLPLYVQGVKKLKMDFGGNTDYNIIDRETARGRALYMSPFLEFDYNSTKLKLNAGARYQHYGYSYGRPEREPDSRATDGLTYNLNTLWQMAPHHALRFLTTRNLIKPSLEQVYPQLRSTDVTGPYVGGGKGIRVPAMYSFELDYITDWVTGGHSFVANLGFSYDYVDGLGDVVQKFDDQNRKFYQAYSNTGVNNIFKSRANLIYSYGILSVGLAGNWFHNIKTLDDGTDHVDSFNLAVSPVFSFSNSWTLSGTFRYNNAQTSRDSRIGECLYSNLRLSKTCGNWIFSAVFCDIFGYVSRNYEYLDGGYVYTVYDQYPRCLELGITYRIG
ncbi:MAG: outer membrane beta-barrel family protein, partial [Bacteroidales bacterium]|nr:outer membrane beta-barrel family protein [Bacteroidales bacterium]